MSPGPRRATGRASFAGLAAACALAVAGPRAAIAEPTIWGETRSPKVFRESQAMDDTERILVRERSDDDPAEIEKRRVQKSKLALDVLREARAGESDDPHVLFRLAELMKDTGDFAGAVPFYRRVVADPKVTGDMRCDALESLAIAAARSGDFATEAKLYDFALADQPVGYARSFLLANQAEAFMVMGRISRAVEGYRAAIASAPSSDYPRFPTTFWSLGVALDRSGDLDLGLASIANGRAYDPKDEEIKGPNWFFVPSYDAEWYWALEELLLARSNDGDPVLQTLHYQHAIEHLSAYVDLAPPTDHYVTIARVRLRQIKEEAARKATPLGSDDPERRRRDAQDDGPHIHPLPLPH